MVCCAVSTGGKGPKSVKHIAEETGTWRCMHVFKVFEDSYWDYSWESPLISGRIQRDGVVFTKIRTVPLRVSFRCSASVGVGTPLIARLSQTMHSPILPGRRMYEGLVAASWHSPEVSSIGSHIVNNCFSLTATAWTDKSVIKSLR